MTVTNFSIREVAQDAIETLIPILLQAEESESALRWSLANLSDVVYCMERAGEVLGAATVQWRNDPSEILELAIAPAYHGQGLGKQFVAWLLAAARERGKTAMLVGTANSSIDNIAFYQKCGFRMDHIRKDYFWYHGQLHYENGLQIRDLLVFKYDLMQASR